MRCLMAIVQLAFCTLFIFVSDVAPSGSSGNVYGLSENTFKRFKGAFISAGHGKQELSKDEFSEAIRIVLKAKDVCTDSELGPFYKKAGKQIGEPINQAEFLQMMSKILSEGDTNEVLKTVFKECDREKKGKVGVKDIRKAVQKRTKEKLLIADVKALVREYDEDNDGCLNFEEFKKAILPMLNFPKAESSDVGSSSSN